MGKKFSKLLGIFLALALILTAVPTAFAVNKGGATGNVEPRKNAFNVTVKASSNKILQLGEDDLAKLSAYGVWSGKRADGTTTEEGIQLKPIHIEKPKNVTFTVDVPEKINGNDVKDLTEISFKLYADADQIENVINAKVKKVELTSPVIEKSPDNKATKVDKLVFLGDVIGPKAQKTFDQVKEDVKKMDVNLDLAYNFTFNWILPKTTDSRVTVVEDGTGKPIKGATVTFWNVKTDSKGNYVLDQNKELMADDQIKTNKYVTDEDGVVELKKVTLDNLPGKARTNIIAIKADDSVHESSTVSFVSLFNDLNGGQIPGLNSGHGINAVIRLYNKEEAPFEVRVFAKGRKEALHAVEGVEVTVFENASEFMGPLKKGKVVYTGKTDENGIAYIKDFRNVLYTMLEKTEPGHIDEWVTNEYKAFAIVQLKKDGKVLKEYQITQNDIDAGYYEYIYSTGRKALFTRIKGADRYATSVAIAKQQYPNGLTNNTIILAAGHDFADALSANGLTNVYQAPILLTKTDSIPDSVLSYIKSEAAEGRLKNVLVVGKTNAVGGSVSAALTALRLEVARVGGANRYETAVAVAKLLYAADKTTDGSAKIPFYGNPGVKLNVNRHDEHKFFVANGLKFADALIASVPAGRYGYPILLTDGSSKLRPETKAYLDAAFTKGELNGVTIMGGEAVVSEGAKADIPGSVVNRIYGKDRYETNMAANEYFVNATKVYVVSGEGFADALVTGHLAAENNAAILMVNPNGLSEEQSKWIKGNKITDYVIVGGNNAVSEKVEMEIEDIILGITK